MALVLCFDLLKFPFGPNVNAMNAHQAATIYLCGGNSYAAYTQQHNNYGNRNERQG